MMLYFKPWYYTLSHLIIGFAAGWYPIIGILALVYQLGQLVLNIRLFPIEGIIKQGNSIEHTLMKLTEIGVGYVIGYLSRTRH